MNRQLLPKSLLILTLGILALPLAMFFLPERTVLAQGGYTSGALGDRLVWQTEGFVSAEAH